MSFPPLVLPLDNTSSSVHMALYRVGIVHTPTAPANSVWILYLREVLQSSHLEVEVHNGQLLLEDTKPDLRDFIPYSTRVAQA